MTLPPGGPKNDQSRPRVVSLRSICIALALMPLLALWVVESELIWYTGHPTAISLFYHVTFVIFLIALINLGVERLLPGKGLSMGEILTIYTMLSIAATLCSHDLLEILIPMLSYGKYNANPGNRWDDLILKYVPSWAIVTDPAANKGLAVGNATLYKLSILLAWLRPLLFWGAFIIVLMMALMFINILFRQTWTEKERLSFPVIQVPLLIASKLGELLRSRLFWIAFGIAASIDIINGFNVLYPSIPKIPVVDIFRFEDYFVERPWNAIGWTKLSIFPFVIGLAYFLPTDLMFSCWFFFLLYKLQLILASALGVQELPGFPFTSEQAAGGYLALGLLAIWIARRHFIGIWHTIRGKPGGLDESTQPMKYRTAVIGFILSFALLIAAGCSLGATPGMIALFFIIFFLYSIAIARMRAELGPPSHDLHNIGPEVLLHNTLGTQAIGTGNATAFNMFFWFNRAYRAHFSAHSIEGFKAAQLSRITSRSMMIAMIIALVGGLLAGGWALLHVLYVHGYTFDSTGSANTLAGQGWHQFAGWMTYPRGPNVPTIIATLAGLIFALFLGIMRMSFAWWVWHPVGYATCSSWSMNMLWASLLVAWVIKLLITRYGGASAFRKAIPFFVGLVIGEFVVGSLWGIYGAIIGRAVYNFWA